MPPLLDQLFDSYCQFDERPPRLQFACANPALISSTLLPQIEQRLAAETGEQRELREERLVELDSLRRYLAQDAGRYPAGVGPIEQLAQQVEEGELGLGAALAEVRSEAFALQLAPLYVHLLTWHAEQRAVAGQAKGAVLWSRLLAAACLAAFPEQPVNESLKIAGCGFVQIAGVALGFTPDGELLRTAVDVADELLRRLGDAADSAGQGDLLHALGSLFSDPFTSTSGAGIQVLDQRVWQQQLETERGVILGQRHQEQFPLPAADKALEKAAGYFERALPLRSGNGRGITLKALAQTLIYLAQLHDRAVDRERLQGLCAEALQLLEPGSYQHNALLALMRSNGLPVTVAAAAPSGKTPDAIFQQVAALYESAPAQALQLFTDTEQLFANEASEAQRERRLTAMAQLIPVVYEGELEDSFLATAGGEVGQKLYDLAQAEGWSAERIAAALFSLVLSARKTEQEELGLQLLQLATQLSPVIAGYQQPVAHLYLQLSIGAAVNALARDTPAEAVRLYAQALPPSIRLLLPAHTLELLKRIADLANQPADEMQLNLITGLAPVALEIDRELGPAGNEALQIIYRRALSGLGEEVNVNSIGMLLQLAKGVRFASLLREGQAFDWRSDPTSRSLLDRIAQLEQQAGGPAATAELDDLLLVSPFSTMRAVGGTTAAERLRNLQQSFDRHVSSGVSKAARQAAILQPEAIQQLLGAHTVLLDYFYDDLSLFIIVYTEQEVRAFRNLRHGKAEAYVLEQEGTEAVLDPLGLMTQRLRQALLRDPDAGLMHTEAAAALREDFELLLGTPTWNYLESLVQSGKKHLCIYPYGALRYYPLQLLGPGQSSLAQRWTVTLLPSLECLLPRSAPERSHPGLAMGLTYGGGEPFQLAELQSARKEITAVAGIFGTAPLLDAKVTEPRIAEALQSARRIHLCAHGAHNAGAPLFQHLFVTPSPGSDGRLYAYEILGLDLHGLEVLSLGICDSALGRFDSGDNLRGLPAAFLSAGTSTIVASLWELSDPAAETFFVCFYRKLLLGAPRLEAFRKAQCEVRSAYPEPRDWAAFCYLGDWDRPEVALPAGFAPYIRLNR